MAVDVGIHVPQDQRDSRNWHAHVLTTTRTVGPEGLGKKTRVLDARATGPGEVEALRESWAGHINRALERENIAARVDKRSYDRQGVDKAPTTHMGPTVVEMEREALVAQGLPPEPGQGIVEAMSQPDFTPVTDRGRANVMASLRNRLQEWARGVEKAMSHALEGVLTRTDPMAERIATWFSHDKAISLGAQIPQSWGGGAPEERAQRFVEHWNILRSQHKKLFRFSDRRSRRAVEEEMRSLAETLRGDAKMQSSLRERREEIGLGYGSTQDLTYDLRRSIRRDRGLDI